MEPTRKLAYFYLATLIAALVSVSLPQPIYIAIITSMNVALAVVLTAPRSNSSLANVLLYFMGATTMLFNVWALYQTFSFFHPHPNEILTITIYFLVSYLVSYMILKPEPLVEKIALLLPRFSFQKPKEAATKNISDSDHIGRMIKYKRASNEALVAKIGNSVVGTFTIVSQDETSLVIAMDEELERTVKDKPTDILDVELLLPTSTFSFKTSVSSLSPPTIILPPTLTHIEDLKNFRVSFRITEPKTITGAIETTSKKIEIHIKNISATGALVEAKSKPLVEFMDNVSDYFEVYLSINNALMQISASRVNKNIVGDVVEYGIEFQNFNDKNKKILQESIFKELNI